MIDITEIRMGNYIQQTRYRDQPERVQVTKYNIERVCRSPDAYDPIFLSKSIMVELGFSEVKNHFRLPVGNIAAQYTDIETDTAAICHDPNYWVIVQFDPIDGQGHLLNNLKVKSVHRMQNLIYELTDYLLRFRQLREGDWLEPRWMERRKP